MNHDTDGERQQTVGTAHDKILSGFSEKAEFLGRSKIALLVLFSPALFAYRLTRDVLPADYQPIGYGVSVLAILAAIGIIQATPSDESLRKYVGTKVAHYTQPHELLHDSNPDESGIDQPTNMTVAGRVGRTPVIEGFPYVGGDRAERTQDIVPFTRAYDNEYAVQHEDGSLVSAIRVTPAPLSTADADEWARRVDRLANILSSTVNGECQWYNPMRAVDYQSRSDTYAEAAEAFRVDAASDAPRNEMSDVLADICEERSDVVHTYQETTFVREHYVLVKFRPDELVFEDADASGGLGNIWGVGKLLTKRELNKRAADDTAIDGLLERLEDRTDALAEGLRTVEDIQATPMPAIEFSQIIADYFRAANMYATADWRDFIRQAPSPRYSTGDPTHDTEYRHVTDDPGLYYDEERRGKSLSDSDERGTSSFEWVGSNDQTTMGLTTTDGELDDLFQDALAPDTFERSDPNHVRLDDELYSRTLAIREWPSNPPHGMLESVLNYSKPGVDVTVSTHMDPYPEDDAKRVISEVVDVLEDKASRYADKWYYPTILVEHIRSKAEEARDVMNSLVESDYALFETNTYISVRAPDEDRLDTASEKIRGLLQDMGARAKPLKHNHDTGFLTTAPTVSDDVKEPVKALADGLGALFSWSSLNLFEPGGISIGLHRDRGEPTIFNLWKRDGGNSIGIFGKVRSGKTTTLTRLLMRMKLLRSWRGLLHHTDEDTLMVAIDPLREFDGLCQLFGGERIVIGGDTDINLMHYEVPPEETRDVIGSSTPQEDAMRRTKSLIEAYYDIEGIELTAGKLGRWEQAIRLAYQNNGSGSDSPTLQTVLDTFRDMVNNPGDYLDAEIADDPDATADIKKNAYRVLNNDVDPFKEGGRYRNLTRKTNIDFSAASFVYLDLHRFEQEQGTAGLLMQILMDEVYEQAKVRDGRTIMAIDEAHYILSTASNLEALKQITLHHGHHDLSLIFSTQQIGEFFEGGELTSAGKAIFDNLATKIYHFTDEIDARWREELDLSEAEHSYIEDARAGRSGTADALLQTDKQGSYPITVDMGDGINPREFAANQYDPSDDGEDFRAYLRNYTGDHGQDVCDWSFQATRRPKGRDPNQTTAPPDGGERQ